MLDDCFQLRQLTGDKLKFGLFKKVLKQLWTKHHLNKNIVQWHTIVIFYIHSIVAVNAIRFKLEGPSWQKKLLNWMQIVFLTAYN